MVGKCWRTHGAMLEEDFAGRIVQHDQCASFHGRVFQTEFCDQRGNVPINVEVGEQALPALSR